MRVAAIDVGTNSTRLLVAEGRAGDFRSIDRRTIVTRLGQDVDRRRILAPEALERTLLVVAEYAATCGELGVERLRVAATSAVRDAHNAGDLLDPIEKLTGSRPELLSGDEEARAAFLGARLGLVPEAGMLLCDIGGGSTELVFGRDEPERLVSLDIGCVRMLEKHLRSDPPAAAELDSLRGEVISVLNQARVHLQVPHGALLVGVAGTVTQLATLASGASVHDPDVTHHAVMSHGDVRRLARRLASLPYAQRRRVKALHPGRVDVIVPGAEILVAVMEVFDAPEVLVSEKDILDGLVMQLLS